MVKWKIESDHICSVYQLVTSVFNDLVHLYDVLPEDAFEVMSWCDNACVGDVYEGKGFTITVEEV